MNNSERIFAGSPENVAYKFDFIFHTIAKNTNYFTFLKKNGKLLAYHNL